MYHWTTILEVSVGWEMVYLQGIVAVSPLITSSFGVTVTFTEAKHTVKRRKKEIKNYLCDCNDVHFNGELGLFWREGSRAVWTAMNNTHNNLPDGFSLQQSRSHTQWEMIHTLWDWNSHCVPAASKHEAQLHRTRCKREQEKSRPITLCSREIW